MGDIGSAIEHLYDKFLLRDVLSFITPGAIIVWIACFRFFPQLLEQHFHWLLYILIFGVFYLVGYAVQCFGRIIGCIRLYRTDKSCFGQRLKIFCCSWIEKPDLLKEEREKEIDFLNTITKDNFKWAGQYRERVVVHKQMCANNFWAIIIAGVFISVSAAFQNKCVNLGVISFVTLLLLFSLLWDYRDSVLAQDTIERKLKEEASKKGCQPASSSLEKGD
ncbi:MAG: hypothetical protein A2144_09045 [Chloroflexi bacterium RBG_16_50_9]|nr:MAG: hypothetical protein A2144_09045 [Chloroflexi bacterium RBG_16_50_9]